MKNQNTVKPTQEEKAGQEEKSLVIQALEKYFEPSETVTAQHELYNQFDKKFGAVVNKYYMYLLFSEGWGNPTGKDSNGNLGYHMKLKQKGGEGNG